MPGRLSTARRRRFCLGGGRGTEAAGVEGLEDSSEELFVFGDGVHAIDGAEEQRQRGRLVFIQFVNHLFERLQIPCISLPLHPPQRLVRGSTTDMGYANFLKNLSWK